LTFDWIDPDSAPFQDWVDLRQRILRDPLGLRYSECDLAAEAKQWHLVVRDKGDVIGGLVVDPNAGRPGEWKVRQVAVHEIHRKRGIGRALIDRVLKRAHGGTVDALFLHSRADVVAFYERLGFELEGGPFEEVGVPHRRMVLRLGGG